MAAHHLQGVEMANLVSDHSEDPAVRGLAFDIATTQTNQVGRMQGWLALWGYSPTGGDQMAWMGHGMARHAHGQSGGSGLMPGMATEEELANLRSLQGTAFDVEFLRLMIRHHQGGLEMAQYAAGARRDRRRPDAGEVDRRLADGGDRADDGHARRAGRHPAAGALRASARRPAGG